MSTMTGTALREAISRLHGGGLDSRYDDILLATDAEDVDAISLGACPSYDYRAQSWRDGHDHAHIVSNDDTAPLLFCGADVTTCVGIERMTDPTARALDQLARITGRPVPPAGQGREADMRCVREAARLHADITTCTGGAL
jgi:hypothetical protein